jgi:hypothetical protein
MILGESNLHGDSLKHYGSIHLISNILKTLNESSIHLNFTKFHIMVFFLNGSFIDYGIIDELIFFHGFFHLK